MANYNVNLNGLRTAANSQAMSSGFGYNREDSNGSIKVNNSVMSRNQYSSNQSNFTFLSNLRQTSNTIETSEVVPSSNHFVPSSNQDIVHMDRPTSKTAILVRKRRAMLEHLGCPICKGYLIDATTIDECMHSFCKSCIVTYLRSHNECPKCGIIVHQTNSNRGIHLDKVLQGIVYKMVPGLYDKEMGRRRQFYRHMFKPLAEDSNEDELINSFVSRHPHLDAEKYGLTPDPKPFFGTNDSIDVALKPRTNGTSSTVFYDDRHQSVLTSLKAFSHDYLDQDFSTADSNQFETYLHCPAKMTISQLKKFVAVKFNACNGDSIRIYYLNEALRDDNSLIDIAYTYNWIGSDDLHLSYAIERILPDNHLSKRKLRGRPQKLDLSANHDEKQANNHSSNHIKNALELTPPLPPKDHNFRDPRSNRDQSSLTPPNPANSYLDSIRKRVKFVDNEQKDTSNNFGSAKKDPLMSRVTRQEEAASSKTNYQRSIIKNVCEIPTRSRVPPRSTKTQVLRSSAAPINYFESSSDSPSESSATLDSNSEMNSDSVTSNDDDHNRRSTMRKRTTTSNSTRDSRDECRMTFSLITDKGIKIVRRAHNAGDSMASQTQQQQPSRISLTNLRSHLGRGEASRPAGNPQSNNSQINGRDCASPSRKPNFVGRSTRLSSSSTPSTSDGTDRSMKPSRHLLKVKPVYRTLVDPSKVKSKVKKWKSYTRH